MEAVSEENQAVSPNFKGDSPSRRGQQSLDPVKKKHPTKSQETKAKASLSALHGAVCGKVRWSI